MFKYFSCNFFSFLLHIFLYPIHSYIHFFCCFIRTFLLHFCLLLWILHGFRVHDALRTCSFLNLNNRFSFQLYKGRRSEIVRRLERTQTKFIFCFLSCATLFVHLHGDGGRDRKRGVRDKIKIHKKKRSSLMLNIAH